MRQTHCKHTNATYIRAHLFAGGVVLLSRANINHSCRAQHTSMLKVSARHTCSHACNQLQTPTQSPEGGEGRHLRSGDLFPFTLFICEISSRLLRYRAGCPAYPGWLGGRETGATREKAAEAAVTRDHGKQLCLRYELFSIDLSY